MYYSYMDSPIGPLLLAGSRHALKVIGFSRGDKARSEEPDWERLDEPFARVKRQLKEYFDGERRTFDVPLAPDGTDFQRAVWHALTTIPYGTTCAYLDSASIMRRRYAPSVRRTVPTRFRSSSLAIA
jgi:methylated-DNA-[protein]-cysteine S-methyltransferase